MAVLYHSDSSGRVGEVEDRLKGELDQLVIDIWRIGDPEKPEVLFGELFDDDEVQNYYEALVGTLKAAKKRGIVKYKSPMLLKGAHDKVMVNLVDETPLPASAFVTKPKVESAPPKPAPPKPSPAPKPPGAAPVAPTAPKPAAAPAKPAAIVAKKEPVVDDLGDELMAFVKTKKAAPKEDATTSDKKDAATDTAPVEATTKAAEPAKPPQSVPVTKPAEAESDGPKEDTTAADAASGVAALDIKDTTKPEEPPVTAPSAATDAGANGTKSGTSESSGEDAAPSNGKATKKKTKKIGSPRDLTSMLSPSMKKKFSFRKQNSSSEK